MLFFISIAIDGSLNNGIRGYQVESHAKSLKRCNRGSQEYARYTQQVHRYQMATASMREQINLRADEKHFHHLWNCGCRLSSIRSSVLQCMCMRYAEAIRFWRMDGMDGLLWSRHICFFLFIFYSHPRNRINRSIPIVTSSFNAVSQS